MRGAGRDTGHVVVGAPVLCRTRQQQQAPRVALWVLRLTQQAEEQAAHEWELGREAAATREGCTRAVRGMVAAADAFVRAVGVALRGRDID